MAVEVGMVAHFLAYAPLTALIERRLYPHGRVPQGVKPPYVVFHHVTGNPSGRHLRGHAGGEHSAYEFEIAVDRADQESKAKARAIRDALYAAIGKDGFRGTWDGTAIEVAFWDTQADANTNPFAGDETGLIGETLDLEVRWVRV